MCTLRYTALISPCASTCTDVLASFSRPARISSTDPAISSTPSSRAIARAHWIADPSSGSAAARSCSSVPIAVHFSGSTINSAPSTAAARVRRSATAMFSTRSALELSWTAATLKNASPPAGLAPAESAAASPRLD
jgi:hypothetical protein